MIMVFKTTIDKAGRVVIPAGIHNRAHLKPGTPLEVVFEDGSVRLRRRVPGPRLVRLGKILIAEPTVDPKDLLHIDVAKLIEEERDRRSW